MATQTLIRVGHSAYKGTNALRLCFSKAQAVRVLRNRGVKRDDARKVVNKALADQGATVWGDYSSVIEVASEVESMRLGYYTKSYQQMRAVWAQATEL